MGARCSQALRDLPRCDVICTYGPLQALNAEVVVTFEGTTEMGASAACQLGSVSALLAHNDNQQLITAANVNVQAIPSCHGNRICRLKSGGVTSSCAASTGHTMVTQTTEWTPPSECLVFLGRIASSLL